MSTTSFRGIALSSSHCRAHLLESYGHCPGLSSLHPPSHTHRRDPDGIFSEPVTDDIAPGYSSIIAHPMDLGTIGKKIQKNLYPSVNEFKVWERREGEGGE